MNHDHRQPSAELDPDIDAYRVLPGAVSPDTVARIRQIADQTRSWTEEALDAGIDVEKHAAGWLRADTWGLEPAFRAGTMRENAADTLRALMDETGLVPLANRCVGEDGLLSLSFSVFRRQRPQSKSALAWHKDAKVYGPGVRSLNVWIPLDPCGEHGPGLELIDVCLAGLAPGTHYNRQRGQPLSDGYDAFLEAIKAVPSNPVFAPGDLLVFHERTIHRTAQADHYQHPRTALELRFFNRTPTGFLWGMNVPLRDFQRLGLAS